LFCLSNITFRSSLRLLHFFPAQADRLGAAHEELDLAAISPLASVVIVQYTV
jgi:hypothetical protein